MRRMFFVALVSALCVLSCSSNDDDIVVSPPSWIRGVWEGQNYEIINSIAKAMGKVRWVFTRDDAVVTKKGGLYAGKSSVKDFDDCTELENTSEIYSVQVDLAALNENPSEVWRWKRIDSNTLEYWPLSGANPLTITLNRVPRGAGILERLKDAIFGP
jgi:hypothetical protein